MTSAHEESALNPVEQPIIELLVNNRNKFLSFLTRRLPSEAAAEEIFQQSLLRAIEGGSEIRDRQNLVSWFYRVLRNALIDYYRSHASESRKNDRFFKELEAANETQSAPVDEVYKAICACLSDLLPTLRPNYAELIRRIDLEGETVEFVAESLNLTPNNLSVRLHRARQALRESLERSCGACSKHACLDCSCK